MRVFKWHQDHLGNSVRVVSHGAQLLLGFEMVEVLMVRTWFFWVHIGGICFQTCSCLERLTTLHKLSKHDCRQELSQAAQLQLKRRRRKPAIEILLSIWMQKTTGFQAQVMDKPVAAQSTDTVVEQGTDPNTLVARTTEGA